MDTMTFSFIYIFVGFVVLICIWFFTSPHRKLFSFPMRPTSILQISMNLIHVISGFFFPLPLYFDIPIRSFGLTLFTIGLFVACSAKLAMKKNWGLPGTYDGSVQKELVVEGPFSYSRNPIYLGIMLMSFGMAIALRSAFIFLIFIFYNQLLAHVIVEEKNLTKVFGKKYRDYLESVPRFL